MKILKSEAQEQAEIFQWSNIVIRKYPCLKYLHSSLNGVKLTIGQAKKAKNQGMKRGVPDLFLPVKTKNFNGLFIELKAMKGKTSPEQKDFIQFLNSQGYFATVCYGSKNAINTIELYLKDFYK